MYQLLFRKRWTYLLLMFLSFVLVTGCNEEDPPAITVSQNLIEVGYERSSTLISVVTNSEWTAVSDADWCHLSRTSGRFSSDLDVMVDECASDTKRSATITLTTRGRNVAITTILVSQSAENCSLTITPGEITVGNTGETVAFAVAASPSIEYTVSSSAGWAVPAVKTGKGNGTIKVAVAANTSHSIARSAVITLAMKNDSEVLLAQFTVNQLSRRVPVINLGQETLSFKQDAVTLKEHTYLIPVITNITGTMHVTSDFTWCKGEIQEIDGFKFVKITTLSNNGANEARDCIVTIVGDVEGEATTTQIKVSQAGLGSPIITLFREMIAIDQHVNDITVGYVPVSSSIKLSAVSDFPAWLEDVKVNTTQQTVTFRVKANQSEEARTGTITLSAVLGNECMIYPITVVQSGLGEAKIAVTPAQLTLPAHPANATEYLATIVAQTRYASMTVAVAEGADWLTATKVQGSNAADDAITEHVKVVATENTGNNARTATVLLTFKYGNSTVVRTFSVVQAGLGDPTLTITNPAISVPYGATARGQVETIYYTRSSEHITVTQAVPDQSWINNVTLGTSDNITFTVTENKNAEPRTGIINVYATRDGMTFTYPVTITQAGYGDVDIRISPTEISLAAALDMARGTGNVTTSFTVVANHPDAVITDVAGTSRYDWLSISRRNSDYDVNEATIALNALPNTTYFDREAIVIVTIEWGNQQVMREVKVTQAHWGGTVALYTTASSTGYTNYVYVDPANNKQIWLNPQASDPGSLLNVGAPIITFAPSMTAAGATISAAVLTGGNWLTATSVDAATGHVLFGYDANEANAPRTATVGITMTYGKPTGGTETVTEVYTITQESLALTWGDIPTIPAAGISRQHVLLQAGEGGIITSISPSINNHASIRITVANPVPNANTGSFYYEATRTSNGGPYNPEINVNVTVTSSHNPLWTKFHTKTIVQNLAPLG